MTPSLEGLPTKAKEARSPHKVRLAPLDTNPVFQCLGEEVSVFTQAPLPELDYRWSHNPPTYGRIATPNWY